MYTYIGKNIAKVQYIRNNGVLKKSSLLILDRHANLKYKYGNSHFLHRGYYVDTDGKNTAKIKKYIRTTGRLYGRSDKFERIY